MDRSPKITKKYIQEAKAAGLTLIGPGKNIFCRTYQFNTCGHRQEIAPSMVRRGIFRCASCLQIKHKQEAKAAGLTFIGSSKRHGYRNYQFNTCGHRQEIALSMVRRGIFRCASCLQIKIKKEAKAAGLTIIGPGKDSHFRTYQFNACGHRQEIFVSDVRRGKDFKCSFCFQTKLKQEAKAAKLTLIGPGKTNQYRTYQFNTCGHRQEIETSCVRWLKFRCDSCLQIKHKQEAKAAKLTLIGPGKTAQYRTYQFNTCGHRQEINPTAVRKNYFICNTCEETSRDLPSKVYLLKIQVDSEIWLKLGYAKTIRSRVRQYQLPKNAKIRRLKVINLDTGREAYAFESSLHKKYQEKRFPIKKMKQFHKHSGFRECYPMKMMDILMAELESKEVSS